MQFTIVSLATVSHHIAEAHKAGCRDLTKKVQGNVEETFTAANVQEAVAQYIAGDLDEMGYSKYDVKVFGCAG